MLAIIFPQVLIITLAVLGASFFSTSCMVSVFFGGLASVIPSFVLLAFFFSLDSSQHTDPRRVLWRLYYGKYYKYLVLSLFLVLNFSLQPSQPAVSLFAFLLSELMHMLCCFFILVRNE